MICSSVCDLTTYFSQLLQRRDGITRPTVSSSSRCIHRAGHLAWLQSSIATPRCGSCCVCVHARACVCVCVCVCRGQVCQMSWRARTARVPREEYNAISWPCIRHTVHEASAKTHILTYDEHATSMQPPREIDRKRACTTEGTNELGAAGRSGHARTWSSKSMLWRETYRMRQLSNFLGVRFEMVGHRRCVHNICSQRAQRQRAEGQRQRAQFRGACSAG